MRRLSPSTTTDVLNQCIIVWLYCVFLNPSNYLDILNNLFVFFSVKHTQHLLATRLFVLLSFILYSPVLRSVFVYLCLTPVLLPRLHLKPVQCVTANVTEIVRFKQNVSLSFSS